MNKVHSPINWENYPSEKTPINEENLNKMDNAIGVIDDRVIEHENKKATKEEVSSVISNVEYNVNDSVFKFTRKNGDVITVDIANVSSKEAYTREESDKKYVDVDKYNDDIEGLTNAKVSYADIVDNLNSDASNLPLSAKQGNVLKGYCDLALKKSSYTSKNANDYTAHGIYNVGNTDNSWLNLPSGAKTGNIIVIENYRITQIGSFNNGLYWRYISAYTGTFEGVSWKSLTGELTAIKSEGATGKTYIDISKYIDIATEIHVVSQVTVDGKICRISYTFKIPNDVTSTTAYFATGGYASANYNQYVQYGIDDNKVYLVSFFVNGAEYTSNAKTWVSYR